MMKNSNNTSALSEHINLEKENASFSLNPQRFYITPLSPCPYLPNLLERKVVTDLTGANSEALHNKLSQAGFRRSHHLIYAPACPSCHQCTPIRVIVSQFAPDRTQRKIFKRNQKSLTEHLVPLVATEEQFALFQLYQQVRHANGEMASMHLQDYKSMIEDSPICTLLVEFRGENGQLEAVSLIDKMKDGYSAVYNFFNPYASLPSLGTYLILWLIHYTSHCGLSYAYLGYWVPASNKMAYKSLFSPSEILSGGKWHILNSVS